MTLILSLWPASPCLFLTLACAGGYPFLGQLGPVFLTWDDGPCAFLPTSPLTGSGLSSPSLPFPTLVSAGLGSFEFAFDLFIPWLLKITFELLNEARLFNTKIGFS